MDKTTKLILWQRITISLLITTCVAMAIHSREQERRIRTIAAIELRNARHDLVAEKIAREEERQEHEADKQKIEKMQYCISGLHLLYEGKVRDKRD